MIKRTNSSTLTEKEILKIRKLGDAGYQFSQLAKRFRVSSSAIGDIVKRKSFTDVPEDD